MLQDIPIIRCAKKIRKISWESSIQRDYFRLEDKSRENVIHHTLEKPFFVPETMKAKHAFPEDERKESIFCGTCR